MKIGVIGCGLIGRKRASALPSEANLVGCFDISPSTAKNFSDDFNVPAFDSINELISKTNLDAVIIATTHNSLASCAIEALQRGAHVFLEKPGAINYEQLHRVYDESLSQGKLVKIGYNHRHHGAIIKAQSLVEAGCIGDLMFIRGRYGHGGRLGYENEWRAKKAISGGGELIDQGSHLIDLALFFLGPMKLAYASTPTYFWNMEVEDNVFMSLETEKKQVAFLHASCTEWKNMFSLEIYGENGKIEISGLGRSYGLETLHFHKMNEKMGPPTTQTWTFPEPDNSWRIEMQYFIDDLLSETSNPQSIKDSLEVLLLIKEIYSLKTS